jgi:hypothetical protein
MAATGVQLHFDEASLKQSFDSALEHYRETLRKGSLDVDGTSFDLETAAGCYFGETLRRLYGGRWMGQLSPRCGANFYTAQIQFGAYLFSPFCWLGYRLSNGREEEGTVESCLIAVIPSMKDGIDYKRQRHDQIIANGGIVIDRDVY